MQPWRILYNACSPGAYCTVHAALAHTVQCMQPSRLLYNACSPGAYCTMHVALAHTV